MSDEPYIGPARDLGVLWDPAASRLADVLISEGRIEIVLRGTDHEWVKQALETIAEKAPMIVVACPES